MQITIEEQIVEVLNSIRHYLQEDGGDIEFVRYDCEERYAYVRFLGNCANCPLQTMTLRAGIQRLLMKRIAGIERVQVAK